MNARFGPTFFGLTKLAFFAASMVYIINVARGAFTSAFGALLAPGVVAATLAASVLFATTAVFLAAAWKILLRNLGADRSLTGVSATVFTTQIGKYLPGNIGHHVGRTVQAKSRLGIPLPTAITSIFQESALVCVTTLMVAMFALTPTFKTISAGRDHLIGPDSATMWMAIVLIGAGLLVSVASTWRKRAPPSNTTLRWIHGALPDWKLVAKTLPHYLAIGLLNGVALTLIYLALAPPSPSEVLSLTGIYALAWILGFVIPGPPGGMGVRDAALLALLGSITTSETALTVTTSARIATLIADVIIFSTGLALAKWNRGMPETNSQEHPDV